MRAGLLLAFVSVAAAGDLGDAIQAGDLAKVNALLAAGTSANGDGKGPPPLYVALRGGRIEIAAALAEHGATIHADLLRGLADAKLQPAAVPILRAMLRSGGKEHVFPTASILWEMGPPAGPAVLPWLNAESTPQERAAALLAFRRIAGDNQEVLAALAAREDAYDALGWNGVANPAVVERLAQGVAEARDDALVACTRIRWPKKPDDATAAAITKLRSSLGKAREKGKLGLVGQVLASLSAGGPDPDVAGHPAGRSARRPPHTRNTPEEKAVEAGLRWLTARQDVEEGFWGAPQEHYRVGVTSLAVLAYLGAAYGPFAENEHARIVEAGLDYLLDSQADDGVFGTRATEKFMYNHTLATLALCEAAHACGHPRYEEAARRGVEFIEGARNPYLAWRYDPRGGENDTSVTCHCLHALYVARLLGIEVKEESFQGGRDWLDKMNDEGLVGYNYPGGRSWRPEDLKKRFPPERTAAMSAAAAFCGNLALLPSHKEQRKKLEMCVEWFTRAPPKWDTEWGEIDLYSWYWGSLALHQVGGKHWRPWWDAVRKEIVPHQLREGPDAGSWPLEDPWCGDGGRVYATAITVLILETPYRYARGR